jgi:hypothetical protein
LFGFGCEIQEVIGRTEIKTNLSAEPSRPPQSFGSVAGLSAGYEAAPQVGLQMLTTVKLGLAT